MITASILQSSRSSSVFSPCLDSSIANESKLVDSVTESASSSATSAHRFVSGGFDGSAATVAVVAVVEGSLSAMREHQKVMTMINYSGELRIATRALFIFLTVKPVKKIGTTSSFLNFFGKFRFIPM